MKSALTAFAVIAVAYLLFQVPTNSVPVQAEPFEYAPVPSVSVAPVTLPSPSVSSLTESTTVCVGGVCYQVASQPSYPATYTSTTSYGSAGSVSYGSTGSAQVSYGSAGTSVRTPVRTTVHAVRSAQPVRSFVRSQPIRSLLRARLSRRSACS